MIQLKDQEPVYYTNYGQSFCGDSLKLLRDISKESIDLIVTSPPFPLERQKKYGGKDKATYLDWLLSFADPIRRVLKETGSFVIDLGGTYNPKEPTRSLYNYKFLVEMVENYDYKLAEEFFWYNPAKLPSPIEYVNKRKIRVKDAVNTVWWFSKTSNPKANVSNVLKPYSKRMKQAVKNENYYQPKKRPSGHDIGQGFKKLGKGAIPDNLLKIANTASNTRYLRYCRLAEVTPNPARFPRQLPEFFIEFLTDPGEDVVLDIFSGSNTTGIAAEKLKRKWISFDKERDYVASSSFWFVKLDKADEIRGLYDYMMDGNNKVDLSDLKRVKLTLDQHLI